MTYVSKWAITAICSVLLAGCGSSQDKAEELVELMGLDGQYKMVVQVATTGYASKYREVAPEKIKAVIEDNISQDLLKDTLVQVYADHFDADELELMIEANKHPDQAMKIIMGSKDGMKLAKKSMEAQVDLQRDMAKTFEDRDEDIVDELDDLQKEARG
jgi:aminopeptidase N